MQTVIRFDVNGFDSKSFIEIITRCWRVYILVHVFTSVFYFIFLMFLKLNYDIDIHWIWIGFCESHKEKLLETYNNEIKIKRKIQI